MAQVSKYIIRKEVADRIFEVFMKSLVRVSSEKEAEEFIHSLLTPTERVMLAKRLAIAFLLEKGYDYRTIQKVLRVSAGTVAFVNFVREYESPGYKKILGKILRDEKVMRVFEELIIGMANISLYGKGSGAWRSLKTEIEREQRRRDAL